MRRSLERAGIQGTVACCLGIPRRRCLACRRCNYLLANQRGFHSYKMAPLGLLNLSKSFSGVALTSGVPHDGGTKCSEFIVSFFSANQK